MLAKTGLDPGWAFCDYLRPFYRSHEEPKA